MHNPIQATGPQGTRTLEPLVIIGSGPAGWTAALYAARSAMHPLVITGSQPGGQLTITKDVENYPGFVEPVEGPALMIAMQNQALRYGTRMNIDHVTRLEPVTLSVSYKDASGAFIKDDQRPGFVIEASGDPIYALCVIVSTGATAKWLGVEGEETFKGSGVSACATCDGFFFRNRNVVVVGGGNTAAEEALFLAPLASRVDVLVRGPMMRAEAILQNRLKQAPNVHIHYQTQVTKLEGQLTPAKYLTTVHLKTTKGAETIQADGLFVAIGHAPQSDLVKGLAALDDVGYVKPTPVGSVRTGTEGLFVAGDLMDPIYRQAVTAAGFGCMAALEARNHLAWVDLAQFSIEQ